MTRTKAAASVLLFVAMLGLCPTSARSQAGKPFVLPSSCTVPFADIEILRSIDKNCGILGDSPGSSPEHQEQNRRKNNLCATDSLKDITVEDLVDLQEKVDASGLKYDREHLPDNRSVLEDLGEGEVVRIVGLIQMARFSNKKTGESVNCHKKETSNDIHIELVGELGQTECEGFTAEIIPHHRPGAWTPGDLTAPFRPVRLTGQLFFDASHHPCENGHTTDGPARATEWEIHPVYNVEICKNKTVAKCPINDDSVWRRLE
ncbi:MAG TPA: hypothetical protein VKM72_08650 [Thermoanaerobaculia bacterium]|nr:hypothetical protein [Thermoanaerobaculia bacterium]